MSGVETRVFGSAGIWSMGRGRRGKKRREAEGGRGKDDARRSTGRERVERRGRETRGGGRRAGGDARRGEGREMKKFYLHFQPFMQRLTPFASHGLFRSFSLSLFARRESPCPSPSSFLLLLLPPRFFFRSRASFLQPPPSHPSALGTSHPLTSAIPQRSPSSLRAMSPRSALPRATTPLRQYDQLDSLPPPFVCPSFSSSSSSASSFASSASSASFASFSRLCTISLLTYTRSPSSHSNPLKTGIATTRPPPSPLRLPESIR